MHRRATECVYRVFEVLSASSSVVRAVRAALLRSEVRKSVAHNDIVVACFANGRVPCTLVRYVAYVCQTRVVRARGGG